MSLNEGQYGKNLFLIFPSLPRLPAMMSDKEDELLGDDEENYGL